MSNDTAFVATFNFQDSSISFCTLPVVNGQLIDIGETTSVNDFEEAGCDSVIEMLESNEVPSDGSFVIFYDLGSQTVPKCKKAKLKKSPKIYGTQDGQRWWQ